MDPQRHAELSARRRGGDASAYYAAHSSLDVTKELCSDNRHRFLHTLWGIRRVAIPLLGPTLDVGAVAPVKTKDVLEFDHVLADFRNRFIPTLSDFVAALDPHAAESGLHRRFREIHAPYKGHDESMRLLLSPFAVTGHIWSLMFTHNTWFLSEMLPQILADVPVSGAAVPKGVKPSEVFAPLLFLPWMENGVVLPPSYPRTQPTRTHARTS